MSSNRGGRILAAVAAASVLAALAAQACSGDNNDSDGGTDATTNDVVAADSSPDVVASDAGACPTYTGSSAFCKAVVANCESCNGAVSACERANFTTYCEGITPYLSSAILGAYTACSTICDKDASSACASANLADASLTAAQQKLATDYCSVCSDAGACPAQFVKTLNIVDYSDLLVGAIDSKCAPDAAAACSSFPTCFFATVTGTVPKNPCADAGGD